MRLYCDFAVVNFTVAALETTFSCILNINTIYNLISLAPPSYVLLQQFSFSFWDLSGFAVYSWDFSGHIFGGPTNEQREGVVENDDVEDVR